MSEWTLNLRRLTRAKDASALVLWNTGYVSYEQRLFGQVNSACYSHGGEFLGATATNQSLLLRVPASAGSVWNDQSARSCYSLRFRLDDELTVKTVDQRILIRSTGTNFERFLSGHTRSVRDAMFISNQTVVSGSDDNTVRMWDIISQIELAQGTSHRDYVRSIAQRNESTFFSASYDHTVLLWDGRNGLASAASVFKTDAQVEKVIHIPHIDMMVCAAADTVTMFDTRQPSTPLHKIANHVKAVTSLAYSPQHGTILTGSLDCRLCFVSINQGEPVLSATKKYNDPITSVAVHPQGTEYATGFANGNLLITKLDLSQREENDLGNAATAKTKEERQEISLHKYLLAIRIALSRFRYQRAIKTALLSQMDDVIVSTLEELQKRGALRVALANQNDRFVVKLLKVTTAYVARPQQTDLAIAVFDVIMEIYAPVATTSTYFHRELMRTHRRIGEVLHNLSEIEKSLGVMDLITSV